MTALAAGTAVSCISVADPSMVDRLDAFTQYQDKPTAVPHQYLIKFSPPTNETFGLTSSTSPADPLPPSAAPLSGLGIDATLLSGIHVESLRPLFKTETTAPAPAAAHVAGAVPNSPSPSKPLDNLYLLTVDTTQDSGAILALAKHPSIAYVEPNYEYTLHAIPNDPYYGSVGSWQQPFDDLYGLKQIDAASAWDVTEGGGVVVAIIDSGVEITHPDLAANIWINADEIAGNGIDDDNNGFIDDVRGWNFHDNSNLLVDDVGHGTHVAGTVAAVGNNAEGVIGVAPRATIMPVRALGATYTGNTGSLLNLVQAVIYAVDNGASVINASWGGPHSQLMSDVVAYAHQQDVVFVASAGNSAIPTFLASPAGLADVITVAANDHTDTLAGFSNWGAGIDISGPGVNVLSTGTADGSYQVTLGDYSVISGTSMSAPHVAGVAALIRAQHPDYSVEQVRYALRHSADDAFEPGFDLLFGHGRLNAANAVAVDNAPQLLARINIRNPDALIGPNPVLYGSASGADFFRYSVAIATPVFDGPLQYQTLFSSTTPVVNGALGVIDTAALANGWYMLRLVVETEDGRTLSAESFTRIDKQIKAGWPQSIPQENLRSEIAPNRATSFADLDGDGSQEVIGTSHQMLHVWHADGQAMNGFPVALPHPSAGAISIYDVDEDGSPDILTPVSALDGSGEIYAYDRFGHVISGYPVSTGLSYGEDVLQLDFSRSISVIDIDGDETPELLFVIKAITGVNPFYGNTVGRIYAAVMQPDGSFVGEWPQQIGYLSAYNSGQALVIDRDGDGHKELLFITSVSSGVDGLFQQYTSDGRFISDVDFAELRTATSGSSEVHAVHAVDLDQDGNTEIAVVLNSFTSSQLRIALLDEQLRLLPGWPRAIRNHGLTDRIGRPLAIAWPLSGVDMDFDGVLELVYLCGDVQYVFERDGSLLPSSPTVIAPRARLPQPYTAVYADVAEAAGISTFFPSGAYLYGVAADGSQLANWQRYQGTVIGSLAAGNIDNDDTLEIASVSSHGAVYVWELPLGDKLGFSDWQTLGGENHRPYHQYIDTAPTFTSTKPSMMVRGSFNAWGNQAMRLVANNLWQADVDVSAASGLAFKFDVLGNWADNFGDNNADGIAEAFGNNIVFPTRGHYRVQFNDSTRAYKILSVGTDCVQSIGFVQIAEQAWNRVPLRCIDGIWQGTITQNSLHMVLQDLDGTSTRYGDSNGDGIMERDGALTTIDMQGADSGTFRFNPTTGAYSFAPTVDTDGCAIAYMSISYLESGAQGFRNSQALQCSSGVWRGEFDLITTIWSDFAFNADGRLLADADRNGVLEESASFLSFPQGSGRYAIEINSNTLAYQIRRLAGINQAPIATIAGGTTLSLDATQAHVITLDASASYDPEGGPVTFSWAATQSAGLRLLTTDQAVGKFAFEAVPQEMNAMNRYITVSVTDAQGQQGFAKIYVEQIHDRALSPEVEAGPDLTVPLSGGTFSLRGAVTNGAPYANVSWQIIGPHMQFGGFSNPNWIETELTVPPARDTRTVYTVVFGVASNAGAYSYDSFTIAYESTLQSNFPSLFVRGHFNNWAASTPMTLVEDHVWETSIEVGAGTQAVKFDVLGNWAQNYGDANADGTAESGAANIAITQGAGSYTVRFNDQSLAYSLRKAVVQTPPEAQAGPDITAALSGGVVTLDGSASHDPDGTITSFWWVQVSGPVVSIANPASAVTQITLPPVTQTTEYQFALNVEDNDGLSDSDFVTITQTGLAQNHPQVYVRGTFNNWGTRPMTLVGNNLWRTTVTLNGAENARMKFDIQGDWSLNFGDNNRDGIAEQNGNDIPFPATMGTYVIEFNDQTRRYTLTSQ